MNNKGMTLVEVMIASSIGIGIFLFLNSTMIKLQKTQSRFEKKGEMEEVKWALKGILSDERAWMENPEAEVPRRENTSNFYYFPNRKSTLLQFTLNEKEYQLLEKNFKCPADIPGCRIAVFDYKGRPFDFEGKEKMWERKFEAVIGFETSEESISRSFLPELKVMLSDTNDDPELRANAKMFVVNGSGKGVNEGAGNRSASENETADPVARALCFTKFIKDYPELAEVGRDLCMHSRNSAPVDCFKAMKETFKANDLIATITCSRAINNMPLECYQTAKTVVSIDDGAHAILCSGANSLEPINCYKLLKEKGLTDLPDYLGLKVCSRARDSSPAECLIKLNATSKAALAQALYICPHHK